jgi:hypothetical protein
MDREHFEKLLALNYAVVEACYKKKVRDVEFVYADTLARKLFQHSVTAFALWTQHTRATIEGIDGEVHLPDWPSIQVLARACVETYLTFHYLYIDPKTQDEFEFRYCAWMLAGFTRRESFPTITEHGLQQIARDRVANERYRRRIRKTAYFQRLKSRTQERVLAGHNWHPGNTMSSMAARIFGPQWGQALYGFMCSYAHSDALAAVQMKQCRSAEEAEHFADAAMSLIAPTLARMTADYAGKFVKARKVLAEHPYREFNQAYAALSQDLPEIIEERRRILRDKVGDIPETRRKP